MQAEKGEGLVLFCSILEFGKGSKILKLAKELEAVGGIVVLGKGTIKNEILKLLGMLESKKEIFFTIIDKEQADTFFERMIKDFGMEKPQHGISFSLPLKYYLPTPASEAIVNTEKRGEEIMGYESIFVIANKDSLDDILEAAEAGGSTGGTIIHGRGSGTQEKALLFNIEIEPEKVIVFILSKADKTEAIVNSIRERLNINEPNAGIIFVMDVKRTLGIYEE